MGYVISLIINLIAYKFYYLVRSNSYIRIGRWSEEKLEKVKFPLWEACFVFLFILIPLGFVIILMLTGMFNYGVHETDVVKFPENSIWVKISKFVNKNLNR